MNTPSKKLHVKGNVNKYRTFKVNKFNTILFAIIKWYCSLINISVIFMNKENAINPGGILYINTNGNVGIGS